VKFNKLSEVIFDSEVSAIAEASKLNFTFAKAKTSLQYATSL